MNSLNTMAHSTDLARITFSDSRKNTENTLTCYSRELHADQDTCCVRPSRHIRNTICEPLNLQHLALYIVEIQRRI